MDPDLLRRYGEELDHLREVGGEFAREFPNIARQLDLSGIDGVDPYVERLLEGFAFLAARIQIKLDAEYPSFVQHLLETVYPNFVSPVPSMAVLRLQPDLGDPNLVRGVSVPRGSAVSSALPVGDAAIGQAPGQGTACEFRTGHEVQLWPLEIEAVKYFSHAPDLPIAQLPLARQVKGGLRIRLRVHGGIGFEQLPLQALPLYISAAGSTAMRLHELVLGAALGTWVPAGAGSARAQWRHGDSVRALGFDAEHALLPETQRGFSGHRLVQEYAALPQRLLFFEVTGLAERLARVRGPVAEIVILFSRGDAALESLVDAGSLALFCTPAINLFHKRLDRIDTRASSVEHHVVPDRSRPMDYEVHSIDTVTGHGTGVVALQRYAPLYAAPPGRRAGKDMFGWYTLRREPRVLSERQRADGARTPYIGTELFMALVDREQAPCGEDIRQLAISAWVTNRDLPLLLRGAHRDGSGTEGAQASPWALDAPAPVKRVDCLRGPTRPLQRLPRGQTGWALVSLLTLNHLAIAGEDPQRAAQALRSMLLLFGDGGDSAWQRLVGGLLAVHARPAMRRLPGRGPLTYGSGIEVQLEVDEDAFEGNSAFMFGSVLERFLARHAAINSCTETALRSTSRGLLKRWPPRHGLGAVL